LSLLPFDQLFGDNWTSSFNYGDEESTFTRSFQEKWQQIQRAIASNAAENSAIDVDENGTQSKSNIPGGIGRRMKEENSGLQAKHPVFMIPGFVTSGLELWEDYRVHPRIFGNVSGALSKHSGPSFPTRNVGNNI
jgi:hypothetical protein